MQKKVSKTFSRRTKLSMLILSSLVFVSGALLPGMRSMVQADEYDDQINALQNENNGAQSNLNGLEAQAASYQDAINKLQQQIGALQASIDANVAQQADLQAKIVAGQQKIDQEKAVLGESIKTMYVDGTPSTIEMLATSKNLSTFVDKQEYRTRVQQSIQDTLKRIADLQKQLQAQKVEVDKLLEDQKAQQSQLASAQAEQSSLLSYNEAQQASYNQKIANNQTTMNNLRKAQLLANARFIGGAGSGPACGGGYPGSAKSQWGTWGCNYAQDNTIDNWGMYNRECVSYTAFRVAASGRHMPYWGGYGNANQWDDNARNTGIPVDQNPRAGDVAISNGGSFGHAMYVESVNSNGTINISQYNASLNGTFSTNTISVGSLVFIHF